MKDAWSGLKQLTGMAHTHSEPSLLCSQGSAARLNTFYAWFDDKDFRQEHQEIKMGLAAELQDHHIDLPEGLVRKTLSCLKVKKAAGPDTLSALLQKSCKDSLLYIVEYIFRTSLNKGVYPAPWKLGEVKPASKRDFPQKDNDLRPIALFCQNV